MSTSIDTSQFEDENILFEAMSDYFDTIQVLQQLKLLPNSMRCDKCHDVMQVESQGTKLADRYVWRCPRPCRARKSIRTGSKFFTKGGLDIFSTIKLLYQWSKSPHAHEARKALSESVPVSDRSIHDYYARFRAEVAIPWALNDKEADVIGGPGMMVEIDEYKLGKRKRGKRIDPIWFFGLVERRQDNRTHQIYKLFPVERKDGANVDAKAAKLPTTTVVSDGEKAHNEIDQIAENFHIHQPVHHSQVENPDTGAHKNNLVSLWKHLKTLIPQGGSYEHLQDYFYEVAWRKAHMDKQFLTALSSYAIN